MKAVGQWIEQRRSHFGVAELDRASGLARSRDAVCWLFSPYL
jgi:hypothetical protein